MQPHHHTNRINLPYPPAAVAHFFVRDYEWIDNLLFILPAADIVNDYAAYQLAVEKQFKAAGWQGNGEIGLIWVPPFVAANIIKGGAEKFLSVHPPLPPARNGAYNWTHGFTIWHVKQNEDGVSFLCSPFDLTIPEYAMD